MRLGIVGAGHIGSTLARLFTAAGQEVEIANSRGPDTLRDVERQTGATAATTEDAVRGKDIVVLTIPMKVVPKLPRDLFASVPREVPVIDTCNYYPRQRDGQIAPIEKGMTESQWVAGQIGHPTIKVFNCIYASVLRSASKPKGDPARLALPVSGDDARQKQIVMDLVDEVGFDPIDNGPLSESWRHQPGTPVYGNTTTASGTRAQLEAASRTRMPEFLAA
jgi:predicted dinucleotide-binding enzyme